MLQMNMRPLDSTMRIISDFLTPPNLKGKSVAPTKSKRTNKSVLVRTLIYPSAYIRDCKCVVQRRGVYKKKDAPDQFR
jgi:hypothetical protein